MATILLCGKRQMSSKYRSPLSRHRLLEAFPIPLRLLWEPLNALELHCPCLGRAELIHCFNRVPWTAKPWIGTFESILPRVIGGGGRWLEENLRERLLRPNCVALLAMTRWAQGAFERRHRGWAGLEALRAKLQVLYPAKALRRAQPKRLTAGRAIEVAFLGNHFARKGGIVALRAARLCRKAGLDAVFHLGSALELGGGIYTDHPDRRVYERDLRALGEPNVVFHGRLDRARADALLERCQVQLMATLDDTFGDSLLEGMSVATPAIATRVCAVPEIIEPGRNGVLLELGALGEDGRWAQTGRRLEPDYWERLDEEFDRLAGQAAQALIGLAADRDGYESLSLGAIEMMRSRFDPARQQDALARLYERALAGAAP